MFKKSTLNTGKSIAFLKDKNNWISWKEWENFDNLWITTKNDECKLSTTFLYFKTQFKLYKFFKTGLA